MRRDEEKNRLGIVSRTTPVDSNNYFNYRINRCIHQKGTIICDTQEQLEEALKKKCREQFELDVDKPKVTIEADMELLQNTELYEDVKELEKVSLGDTVHCKHSKLGILSDARVIELEWDAVRNKLTSVTLGEFQYNFLDDVSSVMSRVDQAIRSDGTLIGQQVQGIINGVKAQLKAQSTICLLYTSPSPRDA